MAATSTSAKKKPQAVEVAAVDVNLPENAVKKEPDIAEKPSENHHDHGTATMKLEAGQGLQAIVQRIAADAVPEKKISADVENKETGSENKVKHDPGPPSCTVHVLPVILQVLCQ